MSCIIPLSWEVKMSLDTIQAWERKCHAHVLELGNTYAENES